MKRKKKTKKIKVYMKTYILFIDFLSLF